MGTTEGVGDGIVFPDGPSDLTPLETAFSAMADTAQDEIMIVARGSAIPVPSQAARDALYPAPTGYELVFRQDMGWEERYYPEGVLTFGTAGWYPTSGRLPTYRSLPTGTAPANNGVWSAVGFNAGVQINHGGFVAVGSTLNLPFAGSWAVQWAAGFSANAGGNARGLALAVDGDTTGNRQGSELNIRGSMANVGFPLSLHWEGPASTSIVFQAYQNSGANLTLDNRVMYVRYVGPA